MIRSLRKRDLLARQPAIVDVEVGVEERLSLRAQERWLGLDPLAWLHFLSVRQEARLCELRRRRTKLVSRSRVD
jgi:hypothetical protein